MPSLRPGPLRSAGGVARLAGIPDPGCISRPASAPQRRQRDPREQIRVSLVLLAKGNATLAEWLDSPVVWRARPAFLCAMQAAARRAHRPERAFRHDRQMARRQAREHLGGNRVGLKKYFYVLRPLLAAMWIETGPGTPPMRFQDLVDRIVTDRALLEAVAHLLAEKRAARETEKKPAIPVIDTLVAAELARLGAVAPPAGPRADLAVPDRLLRDTVLSAAE